MVNDEDDFSEVEAEVFDEGRSAFKFSLPIVRFLAYMRMRYR